VRDDRKNIHYDQILSYACDDRTVVPSCDECILSKSGKGLKEWLRWVRDLCPGKWLEIVDYNKRKRNRIATAVRGVREEY
jgi:hypothetical protein